MAHTINFTNAQTIGVDDLNGIAATLLRKGVVGVLTNPNACKVAKDGGVYTLQPGMAILGNGIVFHITTAETVTPAPQTKQFVSLAFDTVKNQGLVQCTEAPPPQDSGSHFSLLLGEIGVDGVVTDRRQYAATIPPHPLPCVEQTITRLFVGNTVDPTQVWEVLDRIPLLGATPHFAKCHVAHGDPVVASDTLGFVELATQRYTGGQATYFAVQDNNLHRPWFRLRVVQEGSDLCIYRYLDRATLASVMLTFTLI